MKIESLECWSSQIYEAKYSDRTFKNVLFYSHLKQIYFIVETQKGNKSTSF